MIDEAVGKILGMAMAYGVSSLGLFLAYANYRRRILKADKVMSSTAWIVTVAVVAAIAAGVAVVAQVAEPPAAEAAAAPEPVPVARDTQPAVPAERERSRWPVLGIVLPAAIFLVSTWVTVGLYRHFSSIGP